MRTVADRRGLAVIGLVMAGVTAAIVTVGAAVVQRHLDGRLTLEARPGHGASVGAAALLRVKIPDHVGMARIWKSE